MLRKIFGPEKDEVNRDRRRLYNKEIYNLYSSPNFIWVTKSIRMRREVHIWEIKEVQMDLVEKNWEIETTWKT
jgi:hypothetical protein